MLLLYFLAKMLAKTLHKKFQPFFFFYKQIKKWGGGFFLKKKNNNLKPHFLFCFNFIGAGGDENLKKDIWYDINTYVMAIKRLFSYFKTAT